MDKQFLQEMEINLEGYKARCASHSALDLSKNSIHLSLAKNIDICYHWIHKVIEKQLLKLVNIHMKEI